MPGAWLAAALLGVGGIAAGAPPTTATYLRMLDANGDGRVGLVEYQHYMAVGFKRMDRNDDGVIEVDEQPPSARPRRPVTRAQHRAHLAAAFHRQDTNDDGTLSMRELVAPPR